MSFLVKIADSGIQVIEDYYEDEVIGVDLIRLNPDGTTHMPCLEQIYINYEDDQWKTAFIEKFSRRNLLGRETAGITHYLSSWHGPAPLPDEMEYVGKPGDFLVEEYWSHAQGQRTYLTLWVKGNRPRESAYA